MNLVSIAESLTASLLAAVAIAMAAWSLSWLRNWRLEGRLTNALTADGVGISYDRKSRRGSLFLQVRNEADAIIRVRSIVLIMDKFFLELHPRNNQQFSQDPLLNAMMSPTFRRRWLSKEALLEDGNAHAQLLPPLTTATWELEHASLAQRAWKLQRVHMAIEYTTLFGNVALIRVQPKAQLVAAVKKALEPLSSALHERRYDDVETMLNRPGSVFADR